MFCNTDVEKIRESIVGVGDSAADIIKINTPGCNFIQGDERPRYYVIG